MKTKHFEFTDESTLTPNGTKLFRIRCTRAVQDVQVGDTGGNEWVY